MRRVTEVNLTSLCLSQFAVCSYSENGFGYCWIRQFGYSWFAMRYQNSFILGFVFTVGCHLRDISNYSRSLRAKSHCSCGCANPAIQRVLESHCACCKKRNDPNTGMCWKSKCSTQKVPYLQSLRIRSSPLLDIRYNPDYGQRSPGIVG